LAIGQSLFGDADERGRGEGPPACFWFTDADPTELRTFLDRYRVAKHVLPQRAKRAIFQAEASSQARYLSDAVAHITTGLEALRSTDADAQITARFVKRSIPAR